MAERRHPPRVETTGLPMAVPDGTERSVLATSVLKGRPFLAPGFNPGRGSRHRRRSETSPRRRGMYGDFSGCGVSSRDARRFLRMWGVVSGYTATSPDVRRLLGMWAVVSGCGPSSRDVSRRLGIYGDFSGCTATSRDVGHRLGMWAIVS